jgi:hypothetical protein
MTTFTLHSHPARLPARHLLVAVAALLLLLAQALLLLHRLDLAHHADGEPCEICLALSAVGHGLPSTLPTLPPAQLPPPPPAPAFLFTPLRATTLYRSRAPPRLA